MARIDSAVSRFYCSPRTFARATTRLRNRPAIKKARRSFSEGGRPSPKDCGERFARLFLWYDANKLLHAMVARGIVTCTQVEGGMKFEVKP